MQQQHIAGGQAARQPGQYALGIAVARVVAAARPGRQLQALARQHRLEEQVAQAGHGAHEARRAAGHLGHALLRLRHLLRQPARAIERKGVRVVLGVVLDLVAAPHDVARQRGVGAHALANAKEGGARAGRFEQVQHLRRDGGVGPVIKGQRHLAPACGSRRQAGQHRA